MTTCTTVWKKRIALKRAIHNLLMGRPALDLDPLSNRELEAFQRDLIAHYGRFDQIAEAYRQRALELEQECTDT